MSHEIQTTIILSHIRIKQIYLLRTVESSNFANRVALLPNHISKTVVWASRAYRRIARNAHFSLQLMKDPFLNRLSLQAHSHCTSFCVVLVSIHPFYSYSILSSSGLKCSFRWIDQLSEFAIVADCVLNFFQQNGSI